MRVAAIAAASLALALAGAAPLLAAQTATQEFFTTRLLDDDRTSREIKQLLRSGQGFVDRSVTFRDLTGDDREDAVVRVQSGGASGAVAVYVLSTDTGRRGGGLRVVFDSERLRRAQTRVRDGVLRYRSARPEPGERLCCPSKVSETRIRWRERRDRFTVAERREIAPSEPWGDQL